MEAIILNMLLQKKLIDYSEYESAINKIRQNKAS